MAVSTKHRRKLKHNGRDFVWFAKPDDDSADTILHVISADKRFKAQYVLGQISSPPVIVIFGREFSGAATGKTHMRFACPRFDESAIATPAVVARLIEWCLTDLGPRAELPYGQFPFADYGSSPEKDLAKQRPPGGAAQQGV